MKDTDYYAQAATALEQLDILAGYPDGTFGAEKSITRAEMAAIVCRMIDKEIDAEKAKGETIFDDVSSDHWASGYINIASKEGIINGDGNGKFRPEDDVKHEEAIKMVVCALGYGDDIEVDAKDWSKGYLEVADKKGISADLKGTKGKASTRGDVAVMSYNGLATDAENAKIPATPVASKEAGEYKGTQKVKLTTATKDAEIYYTTDGTTPSVKSTKYTKEISISKTSTLKAIAIKNGVVSKNVMTVDYTIKQVSSGGGGGGGGSSRPSTPTYTVSFDLNYEGSTDAPASQTVNSGDKAFEPTAPERTGYVFVGWYVDNIFTALFDFTNTTITTDTTVYARWVDITDTTDTDGDGLTDPLEEFYGTDKTKVDTDEDELSDFIEITVLSLNPLSNDSDNDGTLDGDEDTDEDGIINKTEITNGTDPASKDTDMDGLTDKEEETYNTDPLNADTDDDGVSDGKEIELGTDPLVAQATFSMNLSADNDGEGATASVQMELSGEQVETLSIDPVNDETFFPETMPGYMGQAYDFNVEGEFDSADISFEFDASELGPDADPVIYYFNEETQELEELPTTINGNVATATVSHFSKYILVDRKVYQQSFTWIDNWESDQTYTGVEIVLVVDDSGSMDWNDPDYTRLDVAKDLIDDLPESSKIGIVRFESDVEKLTAELTTDKEYAKSFLTTEYFWSPGSTYMYSGIDLAFSLFETTSEDIMKMMVVLSDGEAHDEYMHDSVVAKANDNKVKIYTVGLGTDSTYYFNNYLKPLAINTGGAFYLASDAEQLAEIYKDISEKIDIDTDSDEDGIPDYYEDNMIIFNGVKLSLDKNKKDTDGDGIKDGDEVVITKEYNADRTKVKVTGKLVLGNPTKPDTDGDGFNDGEDKEPLDYTITDMTLALVEGLSYSNLSAYKNKTVGEAIKAGVINTGGISIENAELIKDGIIIHANDSSVGYWKEFWEQGLGSIAIKFKRNTKPDAVIYAIRGTEFKTDFVHDFLGADINEGLGWDSFQSKKAFSEYKKVATNKNNDYYVTGHSLGGRVAQDVVYKIYNANEGFLEIFNKKDIPEPVHTATFNALGYTRLVYATLENDILEQYDDKLTNFYYYRDLIGEGLGNDAYYQHAGIEVGLSPRDSEGNILREHYTGLIYIYDIDYHGIINFHTDYSLLPTVPHDHQFPYWID